MNKWMWKKEPEIIYVINLYQHEAYNKETRKLTFIQNGN